MTSRAGVTNKFSALRIESDSEDELRLEAGLPVASDPGEVFQAHLNSHSIKEASSRQRINSLREYKLIAKLVAEDDKSASVEDAVSGIVEITNACLQEWVEFEKRPPQGKTGWMLLSTKHAISRHVEDTWACVIELAKATPPKRQGKLLQFTVQLEKTHVKAQGPKHDEYLNHQDR